MLKSNRKEFIPYTLLGTVLLAFFAMKFEYLALPYFWDEAWVYGHAVDYFINSGVRLFPDEASIDYTRGHPMFFTFICSLWGSLFGKSTFQIHLFVQLISLIYLGYVFIKTKKWMKGFFGMAMILMYIANEAFFVQSILVLPEMVLAFALTVSAISFQERNNLGFVIAYTIALYTKESAIVLLPVLFLYCLFIERLKHPKQWWARGKYVVLAVGIGFLHYLFQKLQFGWFLYPFHMEIMEFSLFKYNEQYRSFINDHFLANAQWLLTATGWIFWLFLSIKRNTVNYKGIRFYHLYLLFSILMIVAFNHGNYFFLSSWIFFICLGLTIYSADFINNQLRPLLFIAVVFILGYFAFNAFNFYSSRYNLPIQFWSIFLILFSMYELFYRKLRIAFGISVVLFAGILVIRNNERSFTDVDTYYKYAIQLHQDLTDYCVEHVEQNALIRAEFLEKVVLGQVSAGYISNENKYSNFGYMHEQTGDYVIISNVGASIDYNRSLINMEEYSLVKTLKARRAHAEVYKRK